MALKPCLVHGPPHTCNHTTANPTHREKVRRRQAVELHVAEHGWICPGYGIDAHPSTDLTADHLLPRSLGGENGPLVVLCRGCNARRHNV